MSHLITCEQDNTPQTFVPLLHVIHVSHTKCQPCVIEWPIKWKG